MVWKITNGRTRRDVWLDATSLLYGGVWPERQNYTSPPGRGHQCPGSREECYLPDAGERTAKRTELGSVSCSVRATKRLARISTR